ncbi:hypothetical protein Pcinc_035433 [Petrolisthes cinctipes]|uniref:Uncharacterized protein n=1 Tax=Petrolisthes cinctipes TaxID=88211 RepID=A0AAE1BWZ5_PETCI|nr:hypothetical protein Pcinc_035433 [Petrolisthes cinctipes]
MPNLVLYIHTASQPDENPTWQTSEQPSNQPDRVSSRIDNDFILPLPLTLHVPQPTTPVASEPNIINDGPHLPTISTEQPSISTIQHINQPFNPSTNHPTHQPTHQPTIQPINQPTIQPINQPTIQPINQPINQPSNPSTNPSTNHPTHQPTHQPTIQPIDQPSRPPQTPIPQMMARHSR